MVDRLCAKALAFCARVSDDYVSLFAKISASVEFGPGIIGLHLRDCETESDGIHLTVVAIDKGSQAERSGKIAIKDAIFLSAV